VTVAPLPAERATREDFFGNRVLYFALQDSHDELVVTASSEVEVSVPPAPPAPVRTLGWEMARQRSAADPDAAALAARQFALDSPHAAVAPDVAAYAAASFSARRPLLDAVADLNHRIHRDFEFDPESTTIATPLAEVLERRHGVCQDFAHLAIACVRAQGLGARYVSGYLETEPPPGVARLTGADVSHAWFAVFVPGHGWVDFDPTNDLKPTNRHVTLAWGRDYADVTPLKGIIFGGGAHTPEVAVDMERL
jgi:transglutaminase-like putative cysteine protease